jgi:hypothetical protein
MHVWVTHSSQVIMLPLARMFLVQFLWVAFQDLAQILYSGLGAACQMRNDISRPLVI